MPKEVQISAIVGSATKDLLDRHVRATGVKKGHLLEEALRHYLQALQELPLDVIVHSRLVLTRASGEIVGRSIRRGKPTKALRDLLRHGD
jgi:hypothetical protein